MSTQQYKTVEGESSKADASVTLFVGLPGCGKSHACDTVVENYENRDETAASAEMSDYVRYAYEGETGVDDVGDNSLGRWAANKKEEHGNQYFAEGLATELGSPIPRAQNINVAGVRSPEEADVFRDRFEDVTIISIWTKPDIRFERLQSREDDYTREEFTERKERELHDWGCIEFFTNERYFDHIIPNNSSITSFEIDVLATAVHGNDVYTDPPFPEELSNEHVAAYL